MHNISRIEYTLKTYTNIRALQYCNRLWKRAKYFVRRLKSWKINHIDRGNRRRVLQYRIFSNDYFILQSIFLIRLDSARPQNDTNYRFLIQFQRANKKGA